MNDVTDATMTKDQHKKFKLFAWLMLLSFGITYIFFYNGRQNINLVMDKMAEGLGTTKAALGVVSAALLWCYGFGQLISGRLGAFFGYKRFMMFGIIASAIVNVAISFQSSIPVIAILCGLNGFFQSMVWANGLGVLNKWWPKKKRGFATGLTTAFSGFAQVVTYISVFICMKLTPDWGWRSAFRFPMIPMVLMLVAFYFFFKEAPEDVGLPPLNEGDGRDEALEREIKTKGYLYPYKLLFREPKVILFCLISAIAGVGRYGLITWIPTYFSDQFGLSVQDGILQYILLPIGQACAMFLFPIISDKVFKGKREPMLIIAASVTFVGMTCFPFLDKIEKFVDIPYITTQHVASVMLFFLGASSVITGVVWAMAGDIGGKAFSSTVVGVFDWAVYMGAGIQAAVFGFVQENFGWPAIFVTIGALYVIMIVLTMLAKNMKTKRL